MGPMLGMWRFNLVPKMVQLTFAAWGPLTKWFARLHSSRSFSGNALLLIAMWNSSFFKAVRMIFHWNEKENAYRSVTKEYADNACVLFVILESFSCLITSRELSVFMDNSEMAQLHWVVHNFAVGFYGSYRNERPKISLCMWWCNLTGMFVYCSRNVAGSHGTGMSVRSRTWGAITRAP